MNTGQVTYMSLLLISGVFLGINSLISIPQIDEDKSKIKELSLSLKEELTAIKNLFSIHIADTNYDTITLSKFDTINSLLKLDNNSTSLKSNLVTRINQQKTILENQIDHYYYSFLNAPLSSFNEKKKAKIYLLNEYKKACSTAESEIFNSHQAVKVGVITLFAIIKVDTTKGYRYSIQEYNKMLVPLKISPIRPPIEITFDNISRANLFSLFFIANIIIRDESQTFALLVGLIGFGLLGATIGTYSRAAASNPPAQTGTLNNLFSIIIKSFSASILTYLSIKGGLAIITSNTENTANPYFVLFLCFVAAVYSEEIWQWAKSKILPS